jgi:hypothetical protein
LDNTDNRQPCNTSILKYVFACFCILSFSFIFLFCRVPSFLCFKRSREGIQYFQTGKGTFCLVYVIWTRLKVEADAQDASKDTLKSYGLQIGALCGSSELLVTLNSSNSARKTLLSASDTIICVSDSMKFRMTLRGTALAVVHLL